MSTIKQLLQQGEEEFEKEFREYLIASIQYAELQKPYRPLSSEDEIKWLKSALHARQIALVKEVVKKISLPVHDHTKCPIKDSCIGYQNAESDLENVKETLLAEVKE